MSYLFPASASPNLLVGLHQPDDAAVYRIAADFALIQTTDFFTPIVDHPYTFGAIAAANAMSDVYAMGGEVLFALNIAGVPESVPTDTLAEVLEGGATRVMAAGAQIAGGHTVTNPELFYGLAVTGRVAPEQMITKAAPRPGDRLFLSKPLGTGIITTASIVDAHTLIDPRDLDAAIQSMVTLNRDVARAARQFGVRVGTDITGFGLLGHAAEMLRKQTLHPPVGLHIESRHVPLLPHAADYVRQGVATRAGTANQSYFGAQVHADTTADPAVVKAMWEAETSGGLLLAVSEHQADAFMAHCQAGEDTACWLIGQAVNEPGIHIT